MRELTFERFLAHVVNKFLVYNIYPLFVLNKSFFCVLFCKTANHYNLHSNLRSSCGSSNRPMKDWRLILHNYMMKHFLLGGIQIENQEFKYWVILEARLYTRRNKHTKSCSIYVLNYYKKYLLKARLIRAWNGWQLSHRSAGIQRACRRSFF